MISDRQGNERSLMKSNTSDAPKTRRSNRIHDLLYDYDGPLPVWIRAPKRGPKFFSGFSRAKLYSLHWQGKIQSKSIREPSQIRGTRLFNLRSILDFIESCGPGGSATK